MRLRLLSVALALASFAACTEDDAPGDRVLAKTTQLVQYETCSELESDLENMLIREAWVNIENHGRGFGGGGPEAGEDSGGGMGAGGGRQEGVDYSGTNNQEEGVDEADIVKTDGYHVYALNGHRLHIFGVPAFGQLVPESVTQIEGVPREMLFDKDAGRAVVFSYINVHSLPLAHPLRALTGAGNSTDGWWWRSNQLTKITVLDIADRTDVKLVREVYFEGWYQTARKVDSSVRVSTYGVINNRALYGWWELLEMSGNNKSWVKQQVAQQIHAMTLSDLIPNMYVRTPDGHFTTNSLSVSSCRSFYRPTDSHARGISSIISFDFLHANFAWDADHVVSNWATFYSSQDKIVLAEPAHDWWWYWWFQDDPDQLNVHVFDIANAGKSRYIGSGRVDGQINDQFSIDEEDGVFRLATTTNVWWRWWNSNGERPETENHIWTLEQQGNTIATIGHVGGIAPGERITAARFLGDKGYIVTFRQTDPLWTIDLSDKYNPTVVGELMVPGFSTYLHPLGTDRLLTIGYGGDENGANWRTTIATFDVNNFAHPALTATLPLDTTQGWGWSEANGEHKAFQYFAPKKLLAVPQSNYEYNGGYYRYLSKLDVIDVDDTTGGLSLRGSIDHSSYYTSDNYWSYLQIRRSIFMGDYIYAISDKAITVHRASDLGQVTAQTLPGYLPGDHYWWW